MTTSHLDRHRAAANRLPIRAVARSARPRLLGTLVALTTLAGMLVSLVWTVPRRDCAVPTGGGDTPSSVSSESNSAAYDEQGMSYPAGSADDKASVECFISATSFGASNRIIGGQDCVPWREETRKAEPGRQWAWVDSRKSISGPGIWPITIRDVRICACPPLLGSLRPKPYPEESTTAVFLAYHGFRYQNMVSKV